MDGDQDRAVDALLAMSDPDHVPVSHGPANEQPSQVRHLHPTPTPTRTPLFPIPPNQNLLALSTLLYILKPTQTQLDEEFARQLLLEDEQQFARDQIALRQQRQQQQEQMRQFPYAQRTHPSIHRSDSAQQQQQQQESLPQRDTMTDMQEQFSKLAESTSHSPPSQSSLEIPPPRVTCSGFAMLLCIVLTV